MYGLGAEAMGPPVPPDTVPSPPDVQQQIADVWSSLFALQSQVPGAPGGPAVAPAPAQTFSQWLNANTTTVFIGAAAFVALFAFAKAGR